MHDIKINNKLCVCYNICRVHSNLLHVYMQVQITRRVTLRQTTCTQATIDTATLNAESQLVCQSGCLGSIGGTILNCADFMTSDGWSTGEQMYTYIFSGAESYFEAS